MGESGRKWERERESSHRLTTVIYGQNNNECYSNDDLHAYCWGQLMCLNAVLCFTLLECASSPPLPTHTSPHPHTPSHSSSLHFFLSFLSLSCSLSLALSLSLSCSLSLSLSRYPLSTLSILSIRSRHSHTYTHVHTRTPNATHTHKARTRSLFLGTLCLDTVCVCVCVCACVCVRVRVCVCRNCHLWYLRLATAPILASCEAYTSERKRDCVGMTAEMKARTFEQQARKAAEKLNQKIRGEFLFRGRSESSRLVCLKRPPGWCSISRAAWVGCSDLGAAHNVMH